MANTIIKKVKRILPNMLSTSDTESWNHKVDSKYFFINY